MAGATCCRVRCFDYSHSYNRDRPSRTTGAVSWLPISKQSKPNNEASKLPWSRFVHTSHLSISHRTHKVSDRWFRVGRISCQLDGSFEEQPGSYENSQQEATIDVELPRRSLLVTFTCNPCGARSKRLINRHAYERGLVYVQCSGCFQYHKLVDNLDMVTEYNLKEELGASTDQM